MTDETYVNAAKPFDGADADFTIVSCDNVAFHIHRTVLSLASPFFKDMFALQQPSTTISPHMDEDLDYVTIRPVANVAEDSRTLDILLRICYPITNPIVDGLQELEAALAAAAKYDLKVVIETLTRRLREHIGWKPLDVYAVACRLDMEDEARLAAQAWKSHVEYLVLKDDAKDFERTVSGVSYVPQMATMSAGSFYRLLKFIRTAGQPRGEPEPTFCKPPPLPWFLARDISLTPSSSLPSVAQNPDLFLQSSDGVELPVHTLILHLASASGRCKLLDLAFVRSDGKTVVELDEESGLVTALIKLCYPGVGLEDQLSSDILCRLCHASKKYDLAAAVVPLVKRRLQQLAKTEPVAAYMIAVQLDWAEEAKLAAQHASAGIFHHVYAKPMEDAPARSYYLLLKYAHDIRAAYRSVAGLQSWPPRPPVHVALVQRTLKYATQDTHATKKVMNQIEKRTKELNDILHNIELDPPSPIENYRDSRTMMFTLEDAIDNSRDSH